jgi:hypothetical protein
MGRYAGDYGRRASVYMGIQRFPCARPDVVFLESGWASGGQQVTEDREISAGAFYS